MAAFAAAAGLSCASSGELNEAQRARVERAERALGEDPALAARRAALEAAVAREPGAEIVEDVELRVRDNWIDGHRLRVMARVPLKHPREMHAQQEIFSAETEMAVTRLEEAALTRRAEQCFPSVEAQVARAGERIFDAYASRQQDLLAWNADWRASGMINEIEGVRFELESRVRLANRAPRPVPAPTQSTPALPEIATPRPPLVLEVGHLRETVRQHNPSVALHRASASRYAALADRAKVRSQPWVDFVDVSYLHSTGDPNGSSENGVGGQIAFQIPIGARARTDVTRYKALVREQQGEERALVEEQLQRSLIALTDIARFELQAEQLRELLRLADHAEEVARRWWRGRLAKPSAVAALNDEAFRARMAVLEARERAGVARCTLLAMTGVAAEDWPRSTELIPSDEAVTKRSE